MVNSKVEEKEFIQLDACFYNEQLNKVIGHILPQLNSTVKRYVWFNLFFSCLGLVEAVLFITFLSLLAQSYVIGLSLAAMFATLFSYFIFRGYLKAKKPEQLSDLLRRYAVACKGMLGYREEIPEHHVALANAFCKLATTLQRYETTLYKPPRGFHWLKSTLIRVSRWCHWYDIHLIREHLLSLYVQEYITLVKFEPTNLEIHAALANAYILLSSLYLNRQKHDDDPGAIPEGYQELFAQKFRDTAKRAIEEFKILSHYAPDDPWVHQQLAYSYHDLQMPKEEIRAYETIMELTPDDQETLYKLGVLYFQQGDNAKGLQAYDQLRRTHHTKAATLIKHYGSVVNCATTPRAP